MDARSTAVGVAIAGEPLADTDTRLGIQRAEEVDHVALSVTTSQRNWIVHTVIGIVAHIRFTSQVDIAQRVVGCVVQRIQIIDVERNRYVCFIFTEHMCYLCLDTNLRI